MQVKLSEIFIPLINKSTYSVEELFTLALQPDFIKKTAGHLGLSFVIHDDQEGNLCFAENQEVLPDYRTTFCRADVLNIVLAQVSNQIIRLERDEVTIPTDVHSFFSKSINKLALIKAQKKYLRRFMLEQRNKMVRRERSALSQKICEQLWDLIVEKDVQFIHSYLTMGSEVNVLPLLQKALDNHITVITPKTLKKRRMQNLVLSDLKNMEPGIFGTYHPKNAKEYQGAYDLIIVAGLAFDNRFFRVGYGGGYYDTFLAHQKTAIKVGVCYPFQIIKRVPVEEHDIQLDILLY